jgi:hypothetical protein
MEWTMQIYRITVARQRITMLAAHSFDAWQQACDIFDTAPSAVICMGRHHGMVHA